jgi:hypothetical protein
MNPDTLLGKRRMLSGVFLHARRNGWDIGAGAVGDRGVSAGGSEEHLTSGRPFDNSDADKPTRYRSDFFPSNCSHSRPSISPLYNFSIVYDASCSQQRIGPTASRRNLRKLYCSSLLPGLRQWVNEHPASQRLSGRGSSKAKPSEAQMI